MGLLHEVGPNKQGDIVFWLKKPDAWYTHPDCVIFQTQEELFKRSKDVYNYVPIAADYKAKPKGSKKTKPEDYYTRRQLKALREKQPVQDTDSGDDDLSYEDEEAAGPSNVEPSPAAPQTPVVPQTPTTQRVAPYPPPETQESPTPRIARTVISLDPSQQIEGPPSPAQ